jgi:hypothetical protein
MTRRAYVDQNRKIVFFWSPKAGCTALFNTLRLTYGHDNKYYLSNSQSWRDCFSYIEKGFTAVALVRNPMDRILSSYVNKFVIYGNKPILFRQDMEKFSRRFFDKYRDLFGLSTDENILTFRDFLSVIGVLFSARENPDDNTVDGHWDTQIPPGLAQEKDFRYDLIFDTKNFDKQLKPFCLERGFTFPEGRSNTSPWKTTDDTHPFLGDLPGAELSQIKLSKSKFFDRRIADYIERLYEIDFRYLGYSLTDKEHLL